jgi:hypothetical protein
MFFVTYGTYSIIRWTEIVQAERPGFDSRKGQELYVHQRVQTGSGPHPVSYLMSKSKGEVPVFFFN